MTGLDSSVDNVGTASEPVALVQGAVEELPQRVGGRFEFHWNTLRWSMVGALVMLVGGLFWGWSAQWNMGKLRLTISDRRWPVFVALTHDATGRKFAQTLPSADFQAVDLPAGDYQAQILQDGRLSQPARLYVQAQDTTTIHLEPPAQPTWSSDTKNNHLIKLTDGRLRLLQIDDKSVSLVNLTENQGKGRVLWSRLFKSAEPDQKDALPPGHWGKLTFAHQSQVLPTRLSMADVNGDQVDEIVLCDNLGCELIALSGSNGQLLWHGEYFDQLTSGRPQEMSPIVPITLVQAPDLNNDGKSDLFVVLAMLSNTNALQGFKQRFIAAVNGANGQLIWKQQSSAPNKQAVHSNFIEDFQGKSIKQLATLQQSIPISGAYPPLLAQLGRQQALVWVNFNQMQIMDTHSGQNIHPPTQILDPVRPPQIVRSKTGETNEDHILFAVDSSRGINGLVHFELWSLLKKPKTIWSEPSKGILVPREVEYQQIGWPMVTDLNGDMIDEVLLPRPKQLLPDHKSASARPAVLLEAV